MSAAVASSKRVRSMNGGAASSSMPMLVVSPVLKTTTAPVMWMTPCMNSAMLLWLAPTSAVVAASVLVMEPPEFTLRPQGLELWLASLVVLMAGATITVVYYALHWRYMRRDLAQSA
jgi:hypothetical protein